jgi:phosphoribosylaminoimidazole synthetase
MKSFSESYKEAGVDVTAGYKAIELMKSHVERTKTPGVVSGIGGFGGLFKPEFAQMKEPLLVSGTDGVGTKLKLAFLMDKHDTVGIDCVAMSVNDVICCGAKPMFFLDYIACGKNEPEKIASIVAGIAEGCVQSECALIGGETAEMPGFYPVDEYDLAGFCVGIVDKEKMVNSDNMKAGDVLIGIPSTGVHSNGFSLVREVFDISEKTVNRNVEELSTTLGETLLTPTKIYVKSALAAVASAEIKAISHITGGGFYENIPRMMKTGLTAKIEKASVPTLPIFDLIQKEGNIPERDMYNTFNMGAGMCMAVSADSADKALIAIRKAGETAFVMGEIVEGDEGIILC